MELQELLIKDGQTLVILTGVTLGVAAMAIYRIVARRDMHDADNQRKRDERQRAMAKDFTW